MASPLLHHERITADNESPSRWVLFLHGVFGSGRNWAGVARRVVKMKPTWGAVTVDLRAHAGSAKLQLASPHTIEAAAADLHDLVSALGLQVAVVVGHSFGGKVAMAYAAGVLSPLDRVWLVDVSPQAKRPGGLPWQVLSILKSLPNTFESREQLQNLLIGCGLDAPVAAWLASNVAESGGGYAWRFDLSAIESLLVGYFQADLWPVVGCLVEQCPVHFIKARNSDQLDGQALANIEKLATATGRVHLHTADGGHWLNADNPDAVAALLAEHL